MKSVTVPISDEIFFVLKKDVEHIQFDIKTVLAMQYFKERRLGLGLAAKMAGLTKDEFTTLLGRNGIDIYQYTDEELQEEFELVDKIAEGLY